MSSHIDVVELVPRQRAINEILLSSIPEEVQEYSTATGIPVNVVHPGQEAAWEQYQGLWAPRPQWKQYVQEWKRQHQEWKRQQVKSNKLTSPKPNERATDTSPAACMTASSSSSSSTPGPPPRKPKQDPNLAATLATIARITADDAELVEQHTASLHPHCSPFAPEEALLLSNYDTQSTGSGSSSTNPQAPPVVATALPPPPEKGTEEYDDMYIWSL